MSKQTFMTLAVLMVLGATSEAGHASDRHQASRSLRHASTQLCDANAQYTPAAATSSWQGFNYSAPTGR
jgi:hypothetical protein